MKKRKIIISLISVALLLSMISVTFAQSSTELDLTENNSANEAQGFTLQSGTPITENTTKVKIDWTVSNVNVTYKPTYKWDSDQLKWVEDTTKRTYSATNGFASITITNYCSVDVIASASFTPAENMTDVFDGDVSFQNNNCCVKTPVTSEKTEYEDSDFTALSETITATLKVNANKFAGISNTNNGILGKYTINIEKLIKLTFTNSFQGSDFTLTYNGEEYSDGRSFDLFVHPNSAVSISTENNISTLTVDGKTVKMEILFGDPTWSISNGSTITEDTVINASFSLGCLLSGTKVTLADGSTKLIDDITLQDKLMTFNFYEGKTDGNYPLFILKHDNMNASVITITLDNGAILDICDYQQFFDMDKKTYFYIDGLNYIDAVGKNIMYIDNKIVSTAKIVDVSMEYQICSYYEIFTEYNKNFVANNILTIEPETYLEGVYTIGNDLKIDMAKYQKDVVTYGRYTYEEFADIMTQEEFEKMNIADKKIAVGKGIVSEEWLFDLYIKWMPIYR